MSARDDNFNLKLEVAALLLVLFALGLVIFGTVLTFTIVGLEYIDDPSIPRPPASQIGPHGYVIGLVIFFMPAGFLITAAVSLRQFFVRSADITAG